MKSDTIVAISTPRGVGGIAVARLSGPDALTIAEKHLSSLSTYQPINLSTLSPRRATYCHFDELDDVVAVYFPKGYTGEPTVEISCHGSLYVQQALLQALVDSGARLAEPGEFTQRAFLNGRLDLSQAEAVADLIDSVTPAQHRLAVSQLRGGYAQKLKALRQQLLDLTSLLELELDFSQEDVEFADRGRLQSLLQELQEETLRLIASFRLGNALKRGVPVAIVGKPNAGKSSLLNALLGDDRAIVSDIPGTTRDTIEETLTLDGITFRFIDTAGLRHSDDCVETLGVERSKKAVEQADIVLYLRDATKPGEEPDLDLSDKTVIEVYTKADLLEDSSRVRGLCLSSKTGLGLDTLRKEILSRFHAQMGDTGQEDILLSNARHYEALKLVRQALDAVSQGLADGIPADLVAVDLRDALYHLGTITGEVTSDELLGNIFGRFCIGK
ncbi:MAG: tRNA uridine-5-carboxymethylaminomethyl(34) synthesis GTPase MnmE [Bacteroidales bacterium]|nr:tRNA uridine-5-carboxymethylaminomethyl(34) synthesis GTPase MnmE [Bacteroidales bacterium]